MCYFNIFVEREINKRGSFQLNNISVSIHFISLRVTNPISNESVFFLTHERYVENEWDDEEQRKCFQLVISRVQIWIFTVKFFC